MHILAAGSLVPLPGFLNSLASPLDHYGYWAIALLLLLENIGVPVIPGELAMIAAAVFAATGRADLNIVVVGIVAVIATFAGAEVGYLIGRYAGRELVLRYGKYVLLTPHHLDQAEAIVSRYGGIVVIVARYIVGLREAVGIIAGITQMRWVTFSVYNLIGACAWVATWVTIGDMAGNHIDTIYKDVNRFSIYLVIVLVVLLAAYIVWRVLRHRRKTHEAPARPGAQESPEAGEELETGEELKGGEELETGEKLEVPEELETGEKLEVPEELEAGEKPETGEKPEAPEELEAHQDGPGPGRLPGLRYPNPLLRVRSAPARPALRPPCAPPRSRPWPAAGPAGRAALGRRARRMPR